jgi:hypothetical protein
MYFLNFLYDNLLLGRIFLLVFNSEMDTTSFWQYNFSDPATPIMEGIINFNNDLMFFIVAIIIFVVWVLFCCLFSTLMTKKKFNRYYFSNSVLEILESLYNQDQKIFVTSAVAITLSILLASSIWWINRPGGGDNMGLPIRELNPEEQLVEAAKEAMRLRNIASLEEKGVDDDEDAQRTLAALRQAAPQPAALPSGLDGGSDPARKPNLFLRLIYYIIELLF